MKLFALIAIAPLFAGCASFVSDVHTGHELIIQQGIDNPDLVTQTTVYLSDTEVSRTEVKIRLDQTNTSHLIGWFEKQHFKYSFDASGQTMNTSISVIVELALRNRKVRLYILPDHIATEEGDAMRLKSGATDELFQYFRLLARRSE